MEEWQAQLTSVCGQIHTITGKPNNRSMWAITTLGDVFVWDPETTITNHPTEGDHFIQEIDLAGKETPLNFPLHTGCVPGTILKLTGCVGDEADRLAINLNAESTYKLRHKAHTTHDNCVLHFNPRFEEGAVIRNSMIEDKWGDEERDGGMPFERGHEFTLEIECNVDDIIVKVNEAKFCTYRHRLPPDSATSISLWGKIQPFKFTTKTPHLILKPLELYFRQIGGHLRRVETCGSGVTWGIGYDHTAWVYTGGWGGGFLGALDSNNVHPMADSQDYRVYENQRWNPVTGYTSAGLPTDRYMWSDATGRIKRTRDQVKLLSMHWQWISDWLVDFHVPGGVDRDGWQYAVDFPSTFHANKQFTDYVRRRRWYRRCAVATTGPWQELGHTRLLDVSLVAVNEAVDSPISVWALAAAGQAMVRIGVSASSPMVCNYLILFVVFSFVFLDI